MITTQQLIYYITATIPAFSALICLSMFWYSDKSGNFESNRELRISLTGYFVTLFFNWFSLAGFVMFGDLLIYIYPLRYASLLLTQIFFYRFIYFITCLPGDKVFSLWHYALPILFAFMATLWPICMLVGEPGLNVLKESPFLNWFIGSHYKVRFIFDVVYIILALIRIKRYRQEIGNYASQLQKSYMGWLNLLIVLVIVLITGPLLTSVSNEFARRWSFIPVILLISQHIIIIYNVLIRNFIIFKDSPEDDSLVAYSVSENGLNTTTLNKADFENFIVEIKPFRINDLRITDMAIQLNTNRTYLSTFINTTYGKNFSSFINEWRLRDLAELRKNPEMKNRNNLELIHLAGFGSYQSYLRAKKKENKDSTLKV